MRTKLIIFILILSNFNIYSQNSKILWVHGLNDERYNKPDIRIYDLADKTSVTVFGSFYDYNKNSYIYNNYGKVQTNNSGIPKFGDQINDFIKSENINTNNLIYIGHSMGGMAGQYLNVYKNLKFKGIISIGSFFNGAKVANSIKPRTIDFLYFNADIGPSDVSYFTVNAIYSASRGVRGIAGPLFFLIDNAIGLGQIVNFILRGAFMEVIFNVPANGQTINDFTTYGNYIKYIKSKTSEVPKLNIYGVAEIPPVDMWLKYFKKEKVLNDIKAFYKGAIDVLNWIPYTGLMISECNFSLNYLNSGINTDFMNLINDDVYYENIAFNYWIGFGFDFLNIPSQRFTMKNCPSSSRLSFICGEFEKNKNDVRSAVQTIFEIQTGYYFLPNFGETDGIITKKSAIGAGTNWDGTPVRLEKYNHLELVDLRNYYDDPLGKKNNLRKIFEKSIFTGAYGISFKP